MKEGYLIASDYVIRPSSAVQVQTSLKERHENARKHDRNKIRSDADDTTSFKSLLFHNVD